MAHEHFVNSRPVKPSVPFSCLPHILEHHAKRIPDAPAILAPGRAPLTYSRLYQHIDEMGRTLRAMGIAPSRSGGRGAAEWSGDGGDDSHRGGERDMRPA